jgi:hypothetical protein
LRRIGDHALMLRAHEGRTLLLAETERSIAMDGLDEEAGWRCLTVDGAGLVAAAAEVGADLLLCRELLVDCDALDEWPRRELSRDDF